MMGRRVLLCGIVLCAVACGVPTAEQAARRVPDDGATAAFARPYADVYAAAKGALGRAMATPEWKELRIVHDDPEGGALIAERRLEGVIPGVRVRDLWSFYFTRGADFTTVTYVIDSSDVPKAASGLRSQTKARSEIFPAMAEALGVEARSVAARGTAAVPAEHVETLSEAQAESAAVPSARPAPAAAVMPAAARPAPAPMAMPPAKPAPAPPADTGTTAHASTATAASERPAPALTLARLHATLEGSEEWQRSTRRRTIGGEDIVTVGDWAQLAVRGGRVEVAFPSYPAPPAYDVARLMRFLSDSGFSVDVLPGTAFRAP